MISRVLSLACRTSFGLTAGKRVAAHRDKPYRPYKYATCCETTGASHRTFALLSVMDIYLGQAANESLRQGGGRVPYCPDCGCSAILHDALDRLGNEVIAPCENGGVCWRNANTPFLQEVMHRLAARKER